jgi:hypothetical protein
MPPTFFYFLGGVWDRKLNLPQPQFSHLLSGEKKCIAEWKMNEMVFANHLSIHHMGKHLISIKIKHQQGGAAWLPGARQQWGNWSYSGLYALFEKGELNKNDYPRTGGPLCRKRMSCGRLASALKARKRLWDALKVAAHALESDVMNGHSNHWECWHSVTTGVLLYHVVMDWETELNL